MAETGERVRVILDNPCETEFIGVVEVKDQSNYKVLVETMIKGGCFASKCDSKGVTKGLVNVREDEIIETIRTRVLVG